MIRRQIVRAGWAAMVLLVLTSCGMKDRKQTYPRDEGVTQQQEQAGGQSEKHEASGTEPGLSRKPAAGGGGNAAGAGNAGAPKCQRCRECRNGRGTGLPEMPHQPGAQDRKGRELLSGQCKTWEPAISL
ncbi:MAG: hypothetical protein ACLTCQ_09205 [Enterocloster bolteae]